MHRLPLRDYIVCVKPWIKGVGEAESDLEPPLVFREKEDEQKDGWTFTRTCAPKTED